MLNQSIDVSVIYVNHKTAKYLKDSILSLKKESSGFSYEIIVVDNSESEEEAKVLKEMSKEFGYKLIFTKNDGFGCANNAGAKVANGKYLHFLNCDTVLISNACYELFSYMENNPNCGVAGSNLYSQQLTPNFSFSRYEANIKNEKKTNSLLYLLGKKQNNFNQTDSPMKIDGFVTGASMMVKKSVFERIGGFPKEIFMYGEDVFVCYKIIHDAHLNVINVPSSKIIHLEGKSEIVYKDRVKVRCDSGYIYYKLLFNEKDALKYLKIMLRVYRRYIFVSRLMLKKAAAKKFKIFHQVYKEKYLSVKQK